MFPLYPITQWNETIDSSSRLRPLFTFEPDIKFVQFLTDNPDRPFYIRLDGTDYYDGLRQATCISSADFPTFGPNYYNATRQYVMVVHTDFTFFPENKGSMTIITDVKDMNVDSPSGNCLSKEDFHDDIGSFMLSKAAGAPPSTLPPRSSSASISGGHMMLVVLLSLLILLLAVSIIYQRYVL